jgi:hypothetical protein
LQQFPARRQIIHIAQKLKHGMSIGANPPQAHGIAIWEEGAARRVMMSVQLFRASRQAALWVIAVLFLSIGLGTAGRAQQPPVAGTYRV